MAKLSDRQLPTSSAARPGQTAVLREWLTTRRRGPRQCSLQDRTSLMFDLLKVAEIAGDLEALGFDGAYTFKANDLLIFLARRWRQRRDGADDLDRRGVCAQLMSLAYQSNDLQRRTWAPR